MDAQRTVYETLFLQGLAITVVTETTLLVLFVRVSLRDSADADPPLMHLLACGLLCSGATLPYIWFVLPRYIHTRSVYVVVAECFAVLVEIGIIRLVLRLSWARSAVASLLCNLGSFGIGELLKALRLW
ncbi:MAG: hypothetical protein J7M25_02660 [Deltaproteobacteria bacterium]|nr:hypothetical protein [Deltaproteobacteria bacterium]